MYNCAVQIELQYCYRNAAVLTSCTCILYKKCAPPKAMNNMRILYGLRLSVRLIDAVYAAVVGERVTAKLLTFPE